jgi:hypothetical protein
MSHRPGRARASRWVSLAIGALIGCGPTEKGTDLTGVPPRFPPDPGVRFDVQPVPTNFRDAVHRLRSLLDRDVLESYRVLQGYEIMQAAIWRIDPLVPDPWLEKGTSLRRQLMEAGIGPEEFRIAIALGVYRELSGAPIDLEDVERFADDLMDLMPRPPPQP